MLCGGVGDEGGAAAALEASVVETVPASIPPSDRVIAGGLPPIAGRQEALWVSTAADTDGRRRADTWVDVEGDGAATFCFFRGVPKSHITSRDLHSHVHRAVNSLPTNDSDGLQKQVEKPVSALPYTRYLVPSTGTTIE